MSSKCFVINEWLIHDLAGDNGENAQEESSEFLWRLKEKCDQIAVLINSPWMEKAYRLMKQGNLPICIFSKQLHYDILKDFKKCRLLERDEIKNLSEATKNGIPDDDLYLVETYYSVNANVIVTSDKPLQEVLSSKADMNVRLRDDFLREYFEER
ncbi:MAG: hypothetical protein QME78_03095 [Thermodesulfobacteriota bacterium]|nr:hypothetical protein [Thermodesulfobacteriota bacterium]